MRCGLQSNSLRAFPVKSALLILFTASALIAAEPDVQQDEKLYLNKFEPQEIELDGYSPSESPWKDNKNNSAFERPLVSLMRIEVRLWGLQEYLRTGARGLGEKGEIDGDAAGHATQIIHSEILDAADKALTMLRRSPNRPLTQLLNSPFGELSIQLDQGGLGTPYSEFTQARRHAD
jgi:hypothetical protein